MTWTVKSTFLSVLLSFSTESVDGIPESACHLHLEAAVTEGRVLLG
jgi:hypothetical protein